MALPISFYVGQNKGEGFFLICSKNICMKIFGAILAAVPVLFLTVTNRLTKQ